MCNVPVVTFSFVVICNQGRSLVYALLLPIAWWPLKMSDYPLVALRVFCDVTSRQETYSKWLVTEGCVTRRHLVLFCAIPCKCTLTERINKFRRKNVYFITIHTFFTLFNLRLHTSLNYYCVTANKRHSRPSLN